MVKHTEGERPSDIRSADELLVARAKCGDMAAFEELHRQYVGRIHSLCLRLSGNHPLAEELTQEVFIQAWQNLDGYRGESLFTSWLHRIAVNAFLGMQRARRRRDSWLDAFGAMLRSRTPATGVHPGVRVDLDTAIFRLPEGMRAVFVLHDVEGYRHEEVATMLGIAPGTCKAQLHNARRRLREELDR